MPTWVWAIIATVVLAGFGAIWSLAQTAGDIEAQLETNCRFIEQLDQDVRLLIVLDESAGDQVRRLQIPSTTFGC